MFKATFNAHLLEKAKYMKKNSTVVEFSWTRHWKFRPEKFFARYIYWTWCIFV